MSTVNGNLLLTKIISQWPDLKEMQIAVTWINGIRNDCDRLAAELAQAKAEVERMKVIYDADYLHQITLELKQARAERDEAHAALKSITDRVIPGTVDSVDALTAIVAERDELQTRWDAMCKTAIPADDILKERDDLKEIARMQHEALTRRLDENSKIYAELEALRARCERYEKALRTCDQYFDCLAEFDDAKYCGEHLDAAVSAVTKALAPSGGGGE